MDDGIQHESGSDVEPEDRSPSRPREDDRAQHRSEHRPQLLHGADDAERRAAPVRRPQVRDEREGRRHEATTADALEHASRDEHRHLDGERRDGGPDGEDEQTAEQDPAPVEQVGQAADEGQHRDVAEEEARDDRRRPLEGVDADADTGHHVGQREDDDVGVGGRERDGRGRSREQREAVRAGGRRGAHGRVVGRRHRQVRAWRS